MHFATIAVAASVFSVASAAQIMVKVGDGGLVYNPSSVTAAVGDVIAFQFVGGNHTVTQSTFKSPCTLQTEPQLGIQSGFQAVAAGAKEVPQYSFTVNDISAPLWFFCAQADHCSKGMVFAVNPNADKTFDAFKATAMGAKPDDKKDGAAAALFTRSTGGFAVAAVFAGLLLL